MARRATGTWTTVPPTLEAGEGDREGKGSTVMTRLKLPPLALVIDDDHVMTQLCSRALEQLGVQVIGCDTSAKAADAMQLHGHRIVWILADVVLARPKSKLVGTGTEQESDGARLLSLLKHACPAAIAVQMSGYSVEELASMGYELEVPHFLQKPFTPQMLRTMVKQLLPNLKVPSQPILPATDVTWWG